MAATELAQQQQSPPSSQPHDRSDRVGGRRRPFSTWMKKFTNFKSGSSTADTNQAINPKRNQNAKSSFKKPSPSKNNNPYPESGRINGNATAPTSGSGNRHLSFSTGPTGNSLSTSSLERSRRSTQYSEDGHPPPTIGNKSVAPTTGEEHDIARSDIAASHAPSSGEATNATIGCGVSTRRGAGSTFSSPAPSVRSLTTTLTTIHSAGAPGVTVSHNHASNNTQGIQFTHQFPTSPPATALPAHLAPQGSGGHPATYNTATANNLLTDNASILTLASSSKRRRRRSMDTDASVRALAPSSVFGGSRESLPLSVLSATIDGAPITSPTGLYQPRPIANERASIYSSTGVAPALPSERNSYYANKQSLANDGGSVKSGLLGHGRNDSISGSIGGIIVPGSPLAGPRDPTSSTGRLSRSNSGWGENGELVVMDRIDALEREDTKDKIVKEEKEEEDEK
ncbi:7b27d6e9-3989-4bf5-bc7b-18fdf1c3ab42 [Sclerotinia trifoliorum]|uniref:7b27d6e9-3989-4bf5-bc7b-18fdf1c3ab42 n=1 Tax=Sclerotinia trifoliorum TaxID=28548 RepID=A0A8H2ZQE9_9HELO|nr:7b27d6e9-3989-4bf5-bc7b-18fdf1c3ab42 [Sclerotinia trifoliorum]